MLWRKLIQELELWRKNPSRKPLILRGARQTGKTTLIRLISEQFESFVSLNLELASERKIWEQDSSLEEILKNIEVIKNTQIIPGKTLILIDEIQYEPKAIQMLRYFYEEKPELHVIATGSLMDVALKNKGFSFPVGRVSFLYLYPLDFHEFLVSLGEKRLVETLENVRPSTGLSPAIHEKASQLFKDYLIVGGMPEIVKTYVETRSYLPLSSLKEGLLTAWEEDVPKYSSPAQVPYLQLLIRQAPLFAAQKIHYENFANSGYRSREMRQAFEKLEQAMILMRAQGSPNQSPPPKLSLTVSPKLIYLDTGLVTYRMGLDPQTLKTGNLNDLFRGTLAEQVVGQEIMAAHALRRENPFFWYRNKAGSSAETDYCILSKGKIIPIEVKSGKSGKLRSLLQFIETAPHASAVRIYSGPLQIDDAQTLQGKKFKLLSIPFYLCPWLKTILEDF